MLAAAESGDYDLLKLLWSKGGNAFASVATKNGFILEGTNYLEKAVSTGDIQILHAVLELWSRQELHWPKEFISSALKVPVRNGFTYLTQVLDAGSFTIAEEDATSMICESIWSGDKRTFDLLNERFVESELDCPQHGYPTPLWLALHEDNYYMAQHLIKAGAAPNQPSLTMWRKKGCFGHIISEMPLQQALRRVDSRFIEILVDKGADIHCLIDGSQTPLLISLRRKYESAAVILLSKGANPNAMDILGEETALGLALNQGASLSTIQSLIHYGADINKPSKWGTPLQQVAREGFLSHALQRCQLLLTAGADVNASTGRTAPQLAVDSNRLELAELLIDRGADINASEAGMTALETATKNNNTYLAKLLVKAGADVNISTTGTSVLQLAMSKKNVELVKRSLENGANVNDSEIRETALQTAADLGNLELDHVKRGASINEEASLHYKARALGHAVVNDHTQIAISLIENGASVNENSGYCGGATMLQLAAAYGNYQIVTCLVENGAAVNAAPATVRGATALQYAAIVGDIKIAIFQNGAHVNAKEADVDGRTALEGAAEHGRLDIVVCRG
ncbi:hypothetical protein FOXG_19519 [Fusarium oxysporum f. sp. lycopersici 4287]|uniref:Uncharacterized protein n=1 Tax=Fusarium oxysporum f. sp. lycopersici (strain 4287 / CBS 123668 / FGSC 9935 / NRRL 34936) TaxID=426428 RepID=A0A0J9V1X5_FUSO4|nr:hypothetical protein FOXG_19519 [Fusarium oxysporum f. sp. lycopersici 4287]KNB05310.1 hypothetical protein FOXG_19519 [Fusarium oxysporum f. sp. lycopersici 4287]